MNKKKLPRAIIRVSDGEVSTCAAAACGPLVNREMVHAAPDFRPAKQADNVVEMKPGLQALAGERARASAAPALPPPGLNAERRRSAAKAIVSRYAAGSAIGGMIPLPIVNFAGVTAVIVRMVKALSKHYGVPFERDRARAVVVGLVGGAMPAGAVAVTTSALVYIVPPSAILGVAVSAITAATFTRSIGSIFIEHFESGAALDDVRALLLAEGHS
jgi:uncharacterized protein (DUF697 family)